MPKDLEFLSTNDTSLRNKVFQHIKAQIIEGAYSPGDILLETKLADELGVSRTPIREAIWLLEVEGLVETTAKKGAIVLGISAKDVADICAMRQLLEGLAARWATSRLTENELKELQKIVDLTEFYAQKQNMEEIAELDNKFHQLIYEASGSKMLNLTLSNLHKYIKPARLNSIAVENRLSQTITEHITLMDAFYKRDPDAAEKAMTYHVSMAHRNITSLHH
ncbi:MAG: GntR family transcriptional regulator [Sporomusaceae bacterium]|nr:GntR family transcriptional regulator [Sporomusaceae bacterium]